MQDKRKRFSVLISFLNEGAEVVKTVKSVRDTAGDAVDIIVLNDASTDGYPYAAELAPYNVRYHENSERIGSSAGKERCVQLCETPYFLILDAHCRMWTADWLDKAVALMDRPESETALYCFACSYFFGDIDYPTEQHTTGYGGYLHYNVRSLYSAEWNMRNFASHGKGDEPFRIPVILGANYMCSKKWWDKIGGHKGLRLYGREEAFVSIKTYMAGGSVYCYPAIRTGHKARPNNAFPYPVAMTEIVHNELVIAYVCAPNELYEQVRAAIRKLYAAFPNLIKTAEELFDGHRDELDELRDNLQTIPDRRTYEYFDEINAGFQKRIGFDYRTIKEKNKELYK